MKLQRYEVTLVASFPSPDHRWTMGWSAESFAQAELLTMLKLSENGDTDSRIFRIELW